jgi:hypothetical protein
MQSLGPAPKGTYVRGPIPASLEVARDRNLEGSKRLGCAQKRTSRCSAYGEMITVAFSGIS